MARSKRRPQQESGKGTFPAKQILIGAAVGTVLFFAFILIASAAVLKSGTASRLYPLVGLASAGISALIGGFAAVRPLRHNAVPYGAATGFLEAVAACISAFAANGASAGAKLLLLAAITVLMSCVGGIIAANMKKRRKV